MQEERQDDVETSWRASRSPNFLTNEPNAMVSVNMDDVAIEESCARSTGHQAFHNRQVILVHLEDQIIYSIVDIPGLESSGEFIITL